MTKSEKAELTQQLKDLSEGKKPEPPIDFVIEHWSEIYPFGDGEAAQQLYRAFVAVKTLSERLGEVERTQEAMTVRVAELEKLFNENH